MYRCIIIFAVPTLPHLLLFEWKSKEGHSKSLKIMEHISTRWRKAGILLDQSEGLLERFKRKAHEDTFECCQYVLGHWIAEETVSHEYPVTWKGLHRLLDDLELAEIASQLDEALACSK